MRKTPNIYRAFIPVFLALFSASLFAWNNGFDSDSTGAILILPGPKAVSAISPDINFSQMRFNDTQYKGDSENSWWALDCQSSCSLYKASLSVLAESSEEHINRDFWDTVAQQIFMWDYPEIGEQEAPTPILYFTDPKKILKLVAGEVATYKTANIGSFLFWAPKARAQELEFTLPNGTTGLVLPVLVLPFADATSDKGLLTLELRIKGDHQILMDNLDSIGNIESMVPWVGDLDGDQKLDLIINRKVRDNTSLILWLSSLAQPGEMVGEAGRYQWSSSIN